MKYAQQHPLDRYTCRSTVEHLGQQRNAEASISQDGEILFKSWVLCNYKSFLKIIPLIYSLRRPTQLVSML